MEKEHRCRKYNRRRKQDRHCGRRCSQRMHTHRNLRRERSTQRRYLLATYIRNERFRREEQLKRASQWCYGHIYEEDGFANGLCDCQGYDESGETICPYGASVHIEKPTPVQTTLPPLRKYYNIKWYKTS